MDRREAFQLMGAAGIVGTTGIAQAFTTPCSAIDHHAIDHHAIDHHAIDHHADDHHADDKAKVMPPIQNIHLHFCGIHVAKTNPKIQIVTQHFCAPINDEVHQCLLYDSSEKNAKLLGVEYIISDRMYQELPVAEKGYWHPHTYEVLAGGLIGPSMTPADEMNFMKYILTTWGKTWHTWPDPRTAAPMGDPLLMWSLMADDQVDTAILAERDRQFHVSAKNLREIRTRVIGFEPPQVPFPKSIDQVGRQWKATGDDKPTKRP